MWVSKLIPTTPKLAPPLEIMYKSPRTIVPAVTNATGYTLNPDTAATSIHQPNTWYHGIIPRIIKQFFAYRAEHHQTDSLGGAPQPVEGSETE